MSRGSWLAAVASAFVLLGSAGVARAEVAYSYEVENADAHTDKVLVVWPRACGATGEPLGAVNLALNPDWASRMHDVDYEVVVRGKSHALLDHCVKTSRLYALPAGEFARGTRTSTGDDMPIGQTEAGAPFVVLPALDAIELPKRIELFGRDARVLRTTFRFEPSKASRPATLKAVHEVLEVSAFDATSFAVTTKRAIYMHTDGRTETVTEPGAAAAAASSVSTSSASVASAAPAVPAPGEPAKHDLGTRWIVLAACAGLVVGGVVAYRKKRAAAK
jgi:hypothetical protein